MVKSGKQKQFDRIFFWRHCLCVATLGMAIAEQTRSVNPEDAYACGLLHDFGKIFFDLQGRINYGDFIATLTKSTNPMITDERELMGMGHDDLGAYCAYQWNLPETLVLVIKYHHQRYAHLDLSMEESQLISIVSLANLLSWTQGMGSVDIVRPPILQPEVEENINLGCINVTNVISRMDREMQNISKFYNFVFPSPSQFRANLLRANLKLCSINTHYYYQGHGHTNEVNISGIKESLTAPHKSLNPQEIITGTLKAIYKDFKFDRLYVMRVVKKTRSLKIIEFLDTTDTKINLKSIEIPLQKSGDRFVHCLRSQKPVIIRGKTLDEKNTLEKFNDNFGHQSGDNILKLIANTLKKLSRPFDHVGRYGGEEFIVILNNTNLSQAIVYAERIRREIEHLGLLLVNRFPGLALTVSAGVSRYDKSVKNQEILIAKADKALYQAKETGRNKVVAG